VSGLIIVPQILVVLAAPWAGHFAQSWGRRPLLVIGFGALPIRAFLFMYIFDPKLLMAAQVLDGVSASVLGILQPLIIADVTNGTGRFNSAQGLVGVIVGIGASLSTTVSGLMVGNFGRSVGFLALALIGLAATIIAWLFMSETRLAN
jgi:MFS family permease